MSETSNNLCPYCQVKLEKKPTRKKKCPNCENYIYVRKGTLLTEEEASIKDWATRLEKFDITENKITQQRKKLSEQFGVIALAPVNDAIWSILNELVGSHYNQEMIYLEMIHIYRLEGKDPKDLLAEVHKLKIKAHNAKLNSCRRSMERLEDIPHTVTIWNCNDDLVCEACWEIKKEYFDIDKVPGLPYEKCTNPEGCRCWMTWTTRIDLWKDQTDELDRQARIESLEREERERNKPWWRKMLG